MSIGEGSMSRDRSHDATVIAELRDVRETIRRTDPTRRDMRITLEEVDALLAAVDDRNRLERMLAAEPDEVPAPRPIVTIDIVRPQCRGISSHLSVTGALPCELAEGHAGPCTRDGWSWTTTGRDA